MHFKSRIEAYSSAIILLERIKKTILTDGNIAHKKIDECIRKIKTAIENHEKNPQVVAEYMKQLALEKSLPVESIKAIIGIKRDILASDYKQKTREKFENPLARRAESELPIILLQDPTKAMMESVKRVSYEIIKLIDDLGDIFDFYRRLFSEAAHIISLGAFKTAPTAAEIKKILLENDPEKLPEIMHIHFKFAQNITRIMPLKHAPARKPVGKLAEIVNKIWPGKPAETFFSEGLAKHGEMRSYITDTEIYSSKLFTAIPGRGRTGTFSQQLTNQTGLMLRGQEEYEINLTKYNFRWGADCKNQPADLNSQYVLDLVNNDAVYVAGPSGMTSLFLGQMEILANFESEVLKKNYLTAVVSYIVGGGFHSLHEVIGPAQFSLNLVPGYHVTPPVQGILSAPPNYNQFFTQQAAIDPEFADRHKQSWDQYLQFFNDHHAVKHIPGFPVEKPAAQQDVLIIKPPLTPAQLGKLKNKLVTEINHYIKDGMAARGNEKGELSFFSRVFRDQELTKRKLLIAVDFRDRIKSVSDMSELKCLIDNAYKDNEAAEILAEKKYTCLTKSGLNSSLENIESMIEEFERTECFAGAAHA